MEQDWIKVLASNVSVAGVLLYWIWWLLNERKTDKENAIKRESFWADREDNVRKEVQQLNDRALEEQKQNLEFLRQFRDALQRADASGGLKSIMTLLKRIAAKDGIDTTDL